VNWLGNYDSALQKAHKEKKPLLVLVVQKDSTLSKDIIKNVFMNHSYVEKINQKMVPVIVMYEGILSYPIEMYYTTQFPTLFFVNSQKELFLKVPLYNHEITEKNLEKYLEEIVN
jgi:predicted ATP-grasp superfamily ATP-dependent carboligase